MKNIDDLYLLAILRPSNGSITAFQYWRETALMKLQVHWTYQLYVDGHAVAVYYKSEQFKAQSEYATVMGRFVVSYHMHDLFLLSLDIIKNLKQELLQFPLLISG